MPDSLVPVIMLSAKNNEENVVKGLQQGCNDFCRYLPVGGRSANTCCARVLLMHTLLACAQRSSSVSDSARLCCNVSVCNSVGLVCSKPVKRGELIARIAAHLRVKADATWVNSLVNGAMQDDAEAMKILKSILPEPIILRIQVGCNGIHVASQVACKALTDLLRSMLAELKMDSYRIYM